MNMPNFTGETSLYKTRNHYRLIAGEVKTSDGEAIIPQYFPNCEDRNLCTSVPIIGAGVRWTRTYCCRWDGSLFRSLWFVSGVCYDPLGISLDDEPDPCTPQL
jgi:hypothetical protein